MKRTIGVIAFTLALVVSFSVPAWCDYSKGREAYLIKDYAKALKLFMFEDDAASLYMVGYMYEHGEGVAEDGKAAAEWYTKAAEKDSVKAMYRLGVMYENGYGVEKNDQEAVKWYKKASFKGFVPAKDALKRMERGK